MLAATSKATFNDQKPSVVLMAKVTYRSEVQGSSSLQVHDTAGSAHHNIGSSLDIPHLC